MDRIFRFYKKDLIRLHDMHGRVRMITIEYVCQFPGIDPYEMAKSLVRDGYEVIFDDSSISEKENKSKRHKVYGGMK